MHQLTTTTSLGTMIRLTSFFGQSGTAFLPTVSVDPIQSNFSFVAAGVGCDYPADSAKELECMRKVPWQDISNFVGEYMDSGTTPTIAFFPILDDKIVFSNYTERYALGKVSDGPAIFSTTEEEGNSLVAYEPSGANETASIEYTNSFFACPVAQTSQLRMDAGLKTYRYLYSGEIQAISRTSHRPNGQTRIMAQICHCCSLLIKTTRMVQADLRRSSLRLVRRWKICCFLS